MAPQSSAEASTSQAPILLKAKGGKPFGALANLTDDSSLQLTWKVCSKVAAHLDQGQRIENLSWRLWHLRDVMVSGNGESSSSPMVATQSSLVKRGQDDEKMFNSISASIASRLEGDRKKPMKELKAPDFRWTDTNDALRHKAIMRTKKRELNASKQSKSAVKVKMESKQGPSTLEHHHASSTADNLNHRTKTTKKKIREIIGETNRKRNRDHTMEELHRASLSPASSTSSGTSSSSSSISFGPSNRKKSLVNANANTSASTTARPKSNDVSPPLANTSTGNAEGKQNQEAKSTWTLQEIEDAERELKEQGVELSGPLLAMLADLKKGDLAKVEQDEDVIEDEQGNVDRTEGDEEMDEEDVGKDITASTRTQTNISLPASPMTFSGFSNDGKHVRRSSTMSDGKELRKAEGLNGYDQQMHKIPSALGITGRQEELQLGQDNESDMKRAKPQCVNCGATKTPLWRRDANFELQCNACGLYEKLHKAPRPKSLKQRRNERKNLINPNSSPDHQGSSAAVGAESISPTSDTSNKQDEWMGIHAGAACANCGTSTTPLWRKDREGRIICNACGLYYKLHNSHRPVTMRMDAIKRRSRYDDRRRMGSLTGGANTPTTIGPEGTPMSRMFTNMDNDQMMMVHTPIHHQPGSVPATPNTPNTGSIGNPFFHDHAAAAAAAAVAMASASQIPLQQQMHPFQMQQQQQQHHHAAAAMAAAAAASNHPGHHHHHNHHPHSNQLGLQQAHQVNDGIHIPSALWENQVCPMGAWGENCCQNLPQPSTVDLQSALLAAGASDAQADQAAVTAAMDALLNHGDWIADFSTEQIDESSANNNNNSVIQGTTNSNTQFDPAAVMLNNPSGSTPQTIVGPSYPLKRRKINTLQQQSHGAAARSPASANHQSNLGDTHGSFATPAASGLEAIPSPSTNLVGQSAMSSTAGSNAGTPANDWWSFPASPSVR
ncbi:hypothetical protein L7F22_043898 [Adiantum nelumboides]|nr:hypothetical protein [Adiantum nelumboides]